MTPQVLIEAETIIDRLLSERDDLEVHIRSDEACRRNAIVEVQVTVGGTRYVHGIRLDHVECRYVKPRGQVGERFAREMLVALAHLAGGAN